ncbi:MAG: hypothetical protein A2075_19390 [Geobacteraceae bacterium GWC2_58_44]|nr:MAG: hypothetical protein A2075_19390 [Geobacteraceae bacterium GWC2_58_44]HBG05795.1 DUF1456 domain-containing protein [Geobacter sp.]
MTNNDVFRRLRYAININNQTVVEIFRLSGLKIGQSDITALVKKEDEEGFQECSDLVLEGFLDGLIAYKRGKREGEADQAKKPATHLNNNDILKKIRIALELKEEEMLALFKLAQFPMSKSELTALFRARTQENYKECGDQLLRNFLKGLTVRYREEGAAKSDWC